MSNSSSYYTDYTLLVRLTALYCTEDVTINSFQMLTSRTTVVSAYCDLHPVSVKRRGFSQKRRVVCFSFFFWLGLRVLDKAEYSAFESKLNSTIVSYRISRTGVKQSQTKQGASVVYDRVYTSSCRCIV